MHSSKTEIFFLFCRDLKSLLILTYGWHDDFKLRKTLTSNIQSKSAFFRQVAVGRERERMFIINSSFSMWHNKRYLGLFIKIVCTKTVVLYSRSTEAWSLLDGTKNIKNEQQPFCGTRNIYFWLNHSQLITTHKNIQKMVLRSGLWKVMSASILRTNRCQQQVRAGATVLHCVTNFYLYLMWKTWYWCAATQLHLFIAKEETFKTVNVV